MSRSVLLSIILLFAVTIAASWTVGCRDDIEVPFPPSLVGKYTGIYSFQFTPASGSQLNPIDTSQLITLRFTADDYQMEIDTSIAESLRVFCDNLGIYSLRDGVKFTVEDPNFTRGVCTEDWGPDGSFGLDQTSDTIRLLQVTTDSLGNVARSLLRIVPVP